MVLAGTCMFCSALVFGLAVLGEWFFSFFQAKLKGISGSIDMKAAVRWIDPNPDTRTYTDDKVGEETSGEISDDATTDFHDTDYGDDQSDSVIDDADDDQQEEQAVGNTATPRVGVAADARTRSLEQQRKSPEQQRPESLGIRKIDLLLVEAQNLQGDKFGDVNASCSIYIDNKRGLHAKTVMANRSPTFKENGSFQIKNAESAVFKVEVKHKPKSGLTKRKATIALAMIPLGKLDLSQTEVAQEFELIPQGKIVLKVTGVTQ